MHVVDIKVKANRFSIGFVGDIQYGNPGFSEGAWDRAVKSTKKIPGNLFLVGMGDYIDFMSPSNRARYKSSGLYSSSARAIDERTVLPMVNEVAKMMKQMSGKWVTLLEGHHWADMFQATADGERDFGTTIHSDKHLALLLNTEFVALLQGALVRFHLKNGKVFTLLAGHGGGGGITLTYMLNKLVKKSGGWEEVDALAAGHSHVLSGLAVPKLRYSEEAGDLVARNVPIVNTGSFLKGVKIGAALYPEVRDLAGEHRAMGMPILNIESEGAGKRDFGVSLTLCW